MVNSDAVSTGHVLLGLLSRGQRHGYDLKRAHDQALPAARPIAFGQVYAALDRLHRQGRVEPLAVQRVDGPDRTVYEITADGRAELASWLALPEEPGVHVANPLATKVNIALICGGGLAAERFLDLQRATHLQRMRHHTAVKTDPTSSLHQRLAADYAIAHLDADLHWMDAASARVATLEKEIDG